MYGYLIAVEDRAALDSMSDGDLSDLLSDRGVGIDKSWTTVFPVIGSIAGTGMMLVDDPEPVGDDLGFGPAHLIDVDTVSRIAAALEGVDEAMVDEHFDPDHPMFMGEDSPDEREFATWGVREAAGVFAAAAAAQQPVLFAVM